MSATAAHEARDLCHAPNIYTGLPCLRRCSHVFCLYISLYAPTMVQVVPPCSFCHVYTCVYIDIYAYIYAYLLALVAPPAEESGAPAREDEDKEIPDAAQAEAREGNDAKEAEALLAEPPGRRADETSSSEDPAPASAERQDRSTPASAKKAAELRDRLLKQQGPRELRRGLLVSSGHAQLASFTRGEGAFWRIHARLDLHAAVALPVERSARMIGASLGPAGLPRLRAGAEKRLAGKPRPYPCTA